MKRTVITIVSLWASLSFAQITGAPTVGPAPKWSPPVAETRPLISGAKAWVATRPGLPLSNVVVYVPAGARAETAAQSGLASLTAAALQEGGAGARGPTEFLEAFDDLGASLHVRSGLEGTTFNFTVSSSRLDAALALMIDLLSKPKFDANAFESLKARRIAELTASLDEPRVIASQTLYKTLYGDVAEGRPVNGTVDSVKALTLDDAKKFHAANYASAGIAFIVAGDLTADAVKKKLDAVVPKAFGPASPAVVEKAPTALPAKWVGVDKPGAPQTVLMLARPGPTVNDTKLQAMELASVALGGSFTSRLVQNLREKHGYTYGAGAHVAPSKLYGTIAVSTSLKTEVTADAVEQLLLELKGLGTLSKDEVEKARALTSAQFVDAFSSGATVAGALASELMDGHGPDGLKKQYAAMLATTVEQSQATTGAFAPEGFTVVLVGDRKSIEPALKKKLPTQTIEWK